MRDKPSVFLEKCRTLDGLMGSDASYGNNGAFAIPHPTIRRCFFSVIASDGGGWEHVSAVVAERDGSTRCPRWAEMCYLKGLFWDDEEVVVQYHPAKSQYKNVHPHALHLWRPIGVEMPMPPLYMV